MATNKECDNDDNSTVFWLKKIFEKMERWEETNNSVVQRLEQRIETLTNEVNAVKSATVEMKTIKGHTTRIKSDFTEEKGIFPKDEQARSDFFTAVNKRKLAYYKQLRSNDIATVYRGFLEQSPPFIPRKFREGQVPGESDKQKERMRKLEKTKLIKECERLEEESSKQEHELMEIQKEVTKIVSRENCPEMRQKIKELWFKKIQEEEKVSQSIWEKKKTFFENMKSLEQNENNSVNHKSKQYHNNSRSRNQHKRINKFIPNPYTARSSNYHFENNNRYGERHDNAKFFQRRTRASQW